MTKVLYIGNGAESTGYGEAVRQMVLCMDSVDIDVVYRSLFLNSPRIELPQRMKELEEKNDAKPDVVIQHTLPHFMEYNASCGKNIGLFSHESSHFQNSMWADNLNLLDEVWVTSKEQELACKKSGVTKPIKTIPFPCDMNKYLKNYEPLNFPQLQNKFVFYWIGEFNERKNLQAAVRAFHTEFDPDEPVELVIKTSVPGKTSEEASQLLNEYLKDIKLKLKLYRNLNVYKKETLITRKLSDEDMMRLHKTCHAFMCTSYGEAFCLPAADALGMGKPVIAHGLDYVTTNYNGLKPDSRMVPVFGALQTFPDLLCGNELWDEVDISSLQHCMRLMYNHKTDYDKWSANAIDSVYNMSYEVVGKQIKELLNV
jgi:glycosyltransferase involved in cell wall biosynthesis